MTAFLIFIFQALNPATSTPSSAGHLYFISYLRHLAQLFTIPLSAAVKSPDAILAKVASKPDYYVPFRDSSLPPSRQAAIEAFTSSTLLTKAGLFSLLAYRAVFYGSEWSKTTAHIFNNPDDFFNYQLVLDKPNTFFENFTAYGTANRHRTVTKLEQLYEGCNEWEEFQQIPQNRTGEKMFEYLMKKGRFFGVGGLSALLICGDMECAGFITTEVSEVGKIVELVDKGAANALKENDLVHGQGAGAVESSFVHLYNFLNTNLTNEEKVLMHWNAWMCEFLLCKSGRI